MGSQAPEPGLLLSSTCLGGSWQMACDAWLLEQQRAAFRLYSWSRPTLSLGRHQRDLPRHWLNLAASGAIDLVRRPSGGRAVLHGFGITYALVWPDAPRRRQQSYRQACAWLKLAFAELGLPLDVGAAAANATAAGCFASATAADLVHAGGAKRVGSAQLWRRGCLLQHGEILLRPPAELWRQLFGQPPPELAQIPLQAAELEERLLAAARRALPVAIDWERPRPWSARELAAIARRLEAYRPGAAAAAPSRASPAACIDRTT